jgi:AcrR family transcriptional regulator
MALTLSLDAHGASLPTDMAGSEPEDDLDWRERRRAAMREAILAKAEELIRQTKGTDFTMRQLAQKAGVAQATPYILLGSKDAMLYRLMMDCVQVIDQQLRKAEVSDPIEHILLVAQASAEFYAKDPVLYRPLLRFLTGTDNPEHHPMLFGRAMRLWESAIQRGLDAGVLLASVRPEVYERQLLMNFVGVLQFWIQGEIDEAGFRNHVLYGTALTLVPNIAPKYREAVLQRLGLLEKSLPAQMTKPPSVRKSARKSKRVVQHST